MEALTGGPLWNVWRGPELGSWSGCPLGEETFHSTDAGPSTLKGIDLNRYSTKAFPWEPSGFTPRLLSHHRSWSIFCLGLILVVVLLSLLRTPLPTCWETSM